MLVPSEKPAQPSPDTVEFVPLASGSRGNATLIRSRAGAILVDAGLDRGELLDRLDSVRQRADRLDGILVTHRHLDHVRSAATIARRHNVPLYATERCLEHQQRETLPIWNRYLPGLPFTVAGFDVTPVRLAHDAPETCAFVIEADGIRMGIATDLGTSSGGITQVFRNLDVLYLEFNYDPEMLRNGTYSRQLQDRISGETGHLSNAQAARLLSQIKGPRLERLYLAHLSRHNNTRELALAAARSALSPRELETVEIVIAEQDAVSESWMRRMSEN